MLHNENLMQSIQKLDPFIINHACLCHIYSVLWACSPSTSDMFLACHFDAKARTPATRTDHLQKKFSYLNSFALRTSLTKTISRGYLITFEAPALSGGVVESYL